GIGSGTRPIAGADPAAGLYELSRLVLEEPSLRDLFACERDDERLAERIAAASFNVGPTGQEVVGTAPGFPGRSPHMPDDPPHPPLLRLREALARFFDRSGHRGFREAELRNPCWREQPSAVIAHLRTHLEPGSLAPSAIAERQAALSRR